MKLSTDAELRLLQQEAFGYFLHETSPINGLVIDKNAPDWPASIAATGLALAAYPVRVERGFMSRATAVERTLKTLRFFWNSPQGPEPDATGHHGFYYHFLDMRTGRRVWECELSTVDSAFLLAGALTAGAYFDGNTAGEQEIRTLADELYQRADWQWAQNNGDTVTHGWKPESGFIKYRWGGYDEAMLLYILGLGSPTHPLPESSYAAWASTYEWKRCYGFDYLYAGPLFTHQLSLSGLISEVFGMPSCVPKALITSKTAAVRPTCSYNTPSTIRSNLPAIVLVAGAFPPAMALGPTPSKVTRKKYPPLILLKFEVE